MQGNKSKKELVVTDEDLKEVEDPVMATALILKELRRMNDRLDTIDWKSWEMMKKISPESNG
jgi:hypothetical protein